MTYIDIREVDNPGRKTKRFIVTSKDGHYLGKIAWSGTWRCYVFCPMERTVFERVCMREIADFIESETKRYKEKLDA